MIERRTLETSKLATIDETEAVDNPREYKGQYVRLQPTAAATDATLKESKTSLVKAGAKAVKIMPRPPANTVALSAVARKVQQLSAGNALPPIRELCDALVDESASKHKPEVKALLSALADKVGL